MLALLATDSCDVEPLSKSFCALLAHPHSGVHVGISFSTEKAAVTLLFGLVRSQLVHGNGVAPRHSVPPAPRKLEDTDGRALDGVWNDDGEA